MEMAMPDLDQIKQEKQGPKPGALVHSPGGAVGPVLDLVQIALCGALPEVVLRVIEHINRRLSHVAGVLGSRTSRRSIRTFAAGPDDAGFCPVITRWAWVGIAAGRGRPALGRFDSYTYDRLIAEISATSPFTMASAK